MADAIDAYAREQIGELRASLRGVEAEVHVIKDDMAEIKDGIGKLLTLHTYEVEPTKALSLQNKGDIEELRPKVVLASSTIERLDQGAREAAHAEGQATREKMADDTKRLEIWLQWLGGGGLTLIVILLGLLVANLPGCEAPAELPALGAEGDDARGRHDRQADRQPESDVQEPQRPPPLVVRFDRPGEVYALTAGAGKYRIAAGPRLRPVPAAPDGLALARPRQPDGLDHARRVGRRGGHRGVPCEDAGGERVGEVVPCEPAAPKGPPRPGVVALHPSDVSKPGQQVALFDRGPSAYITWASAPVHLVKGGKGQVLGARPVLRLDGPPRLLR